MTAIANRPAARWLPSRSHFAFFRLIGFLASRRACDQEPEPGVLAMNPEQNAIEHYSMSAFSMLTITWYLTLAFEHVIVVPAAVIVSLLLSPIVVQLPLYLVGGAILPLWRKVTGRGDANHLHIHSVMLMAIFFALAVIFAFRGGWTRWLAFVWLAAGCINAIAAVVMFFARHRVRELERRCGA